MLLPRDLKSANFLQPRHSLGRGGSILLGMGIMRSPRPDSEVNICVSQLLQEGRGENMPYLYVPKWLPDGFFFNHSVFISKLSVVNRSLK